VTKNTENRFTAPNSHRNRGINARATSVIVGGLRLGLGLGGFLTPLRVLSFAALVGGELVPASPPIEAAAAKQKHDDDND
jgi:hypothetical protein